ncbi:L,D-transpeptidase family protein [Methyloceanibacter caenitepidi]|uniref:L,D-TPase catalytic domain-containing protein n=1 Tax=Methyloceanibacter caenitepidi TaxID=1384459 RepID=A0A0A8K1I6_9HYPH|nr:L,D-transpeptidase family protein [Methyloceanibacter caenitepidi]BAQ16785.1 hypothetical protein GL4_1327 [Methyloceanibacter caenitepidi]
MRFICLSTMAILFAPALPLSAGATDIYSSATHLPAMSASDMSASDAAEISKAPLVELIDTGPAGVAEAATPAGDDESLAETSELDAQEAELTDGIEAVQVMQPIAMSEDLDSAEPANEKLAGLQLPDAVPLEPAKLVPVSLTTPSLKEIALQSKATPEPLDETVARDDLVEMEPSEPVEPVEIASTEITGRHIAEPLTLIISLKDQQLHVYRGLDRVESTRVSSGMRGYQTLTGVFGILEKKPEHYSNLYDNAPMPWMQRLTRSGTALHAGVVPNYPASHGCVRMPYKFAPKLFRMTEVGGKVAMMTGPMVEPKRIESAALVKPAAPADTDEVPVDDSVDAGLRAGALAAAFAPEEKLAAATGDGSDAEEDERPWHILVTRREERDIAIGTQEALAAMGYLEPQDQFVGYLGDGTRKAIRAFEKDHGLRQRGVFSEDIAAKVYEAAGKGPLPDAYLFLRKGFSRVRHVPVQLSDPKKPLGTHLFTYVHPSDGSDPGWVGISLEGEDSKEVLDRITIPEDMQEEIAGGLTSGASFIVADVAKHSSVLPEGDDFIVRTNDSAKSNVVAEKAKAEQRKLARQRAAAQRERVAEREVRRRGIFSQQRARTRSPVSSPRGFGLFRRGR